MKILKLTLRNFKGIRDFTLDSRGDNVSVSGDNATGKTTLFDAFLWLLFGKDSQNKKDFDIKTLDATGKPFSGLDHEVEGVFEVNGRQLTLKKSYKEKWTQKRGSVTREFSGHTTDHFVDGVPVPEKDYIAQIAKIAQEDIFKLLTNPGYFNEKLKWTDRRKILLEVCGDLSDEDVIASDESLSGLPAILQGRKLEDHKKVIGARRAEINKELEKIPVRIDEATKALPDISGVDINEITGKITVLKTRLQAKNQEVARIQGGGEIAEKTKALREVESRLLDIKNKHREAVDGKSNKKRLELSKARDEAGNIDRTIKDKQRTVKGNENLIAETAAKITKLRENWFEVDGQKFEFAQESTCPTCGQSLPEERLTEAREKALADFNRNKAEKLEEINKTGKGYKDTAEKLKAENATLENAIAGEKERLVVAEQKVADLKTEIETMTNAAGDVTENPEYIQANKEIEQIKNSIADLKTGAEGQTVSVKAEIGLIEGEIAGLEKTLAQVDQFKKGQDRIKALGEQQKTLAAEYEKLEKELYLAEQFVRSKVALLEGKINGRFKMARFKLFEVQVNGGVVECCETIYGGVPYSSGLNNAARINVGLDIINTLSGHYGFVAPVFIDNAEAVTQLIETRGQLISLVVSEQDKKLRVEVA